MADISSIKVGSSTYTIKDTTARSSASTNASAITGLQSIVNNLQDDQIDSLSNSQTTTTVSVEYNGTGGEGHGYATTIPAATTSLAGVMTAAMVTKLNSLQAVAGKAMSMIGVTSTNLTDGTASTSELTAASTGSLTKTKGFVQGDVVIVQNSSTSNGKEFVCVADKWVEFGDTSHLGAMASWNSAKGTISIPTTDHKHTVTIPAYSHAVTQGTVSASGSYTPAGTVSISTAQGSQANENIFINSHSTDGSKTWELTDQSQFTAVTASKCGSNVAAVTAINGGSCSATGAVSNVYTPTATGTWPSCSVSGEVLTISAGTAPTWGSAHTVIGGVSYTAASVKATSNVAGAASNVTACAINKYSDTASGSVNGRDALDTKISKGFTGTAATISVSGKTSGVAVASHASASATTAATGNTTSATVTISKLS